MSTLKNIINQPIVGADILMGTLCSIRIFNEIDYNIVLEAFNKIKEFENLMSTYKHDSEISLINSMSGNKPVKVSFDTFYLIKKAIEYSNKTNGLLNISIYPLVKKWAINSENANIPHKEDIEKLLKIIDYKHIELNEEEQTVFLKKYGMGIDLGAIAKGYTADVVANILKRNGVTSAVIDLGGNLYCIGLNVNDNKWRIGIQNPHINIERGTIVGYVEIENKSLVTSGIYERYFENNNKVYHHLLNPATGYPIDNELASVTIISDLSIEGDGLSTPIFLMGIEKGMKFIEKTNGVEAIFICKNDNVYITSGLIDNFVLRDNNFKIIK